MSNDKRGQWKVVFNPAATGYLAHVGCASAAAMTQEIQQAFHSNGNAWYPSQAEAEVTEARLEPSGVAKDRLVCSLSFSSTGVDLIEHWADAGRKSVAAVIRTVIGDHFDLDNPMWERSGCTVEAVEPI